MSILVTGAFSLESGSIQEQMERQIEQIERQNFFSRTVNLVLRVSLLPFGEGKKRDPGNKGCLETQPTAPISDRDHFCKLPTGLFLCF